MRQLYFLYKFVDCFLMLTHLFVFQLRVSGSQLYLVTFVPTNAKLAMYPLGISCARMVNGQIHRSV